ncbi:MAG: hypothetical protein IKP60_07215 [Treponema sp.]|nr:hypothetical protein [Treponema sp.]
MIAWPEGVRQRIQRDSGWKNPTGTVADKTRCGRKKVRPALSLQPKVFSVSILLRYSEFVIFDDWFTKTLRHGALSFAYPRIDRIGGEPVEYRFVPGSEVSYSNAGGTLTKASMEWEEV